MDNVEEIEFYSRLLEFQELLKQKGCSLCGVKDFEERNERIVHYTINRIEDRREVKEDPPDMTRSELSESSNRARTYLVCNSCGVLHGLVPER